jgi:hypothetical protein
LSAVSTVSRNGVVGVVGGGKGKTGVTERRAVIRDVELNAGGSDN